MSQVLAMPFRMSRAGEAVTVEQGGDDYYKQQLAAIILTYQGERPISDGLGMPDMAFDGFSPAELGSQVGRYLPEVNSIQVAIDYPTDTTQAVTVTFDISPERI